jgi:16S rRNA (guanine966-N2)-methyltransferase
MKKPNKYRPAPAGESRRRVLPYRLRIIAGNWRGSRLDFPQLAAIRPTPDRVRETLFNWLAGRLNGARCLDLFAGSGALGLEALSRGAAEVVFVERDPRIGRYLRESLQRFDCDRGDVVVGSAWDYLRGRGRPFQVVFLDPPFGERLAERALFELHASGLLASDALVYVETPIEESPPELPPGWQLLRQGRAGQVGYHLARPPSTGESTGDVAEP